MVAEDTCLIISTYNWPQALELTLKSILVQTYMPGQVIVADDGSGQETRAMVDRYAPEFPRGLLHIWHEDRGFRLAAIRNKAIAACNKPYIIQVDGDIILHPRFIEDHLAFACPGQLIQGSRVMLGKRISRQLLLKKKIHISMFSPGIKRRENGIRIPAFTRYFVARYRNRFPRYYARGANMAFWKDDLLKVNGYNEAFEGWGHEDSDLTLRLLNAGVKKAVLKFGAIVYHLYHRENPSKEKDLENQKILRETLAQKQIWCGNGLDKYLSKNATE